MKMKSCIFDVFWGSCTYTEKTMHVVLLSCCGVKKPYMRREKENKNMSYLLGLNAVMLIHGLGFFFEFG